MTTRLYSLDVLRGLDMFLLTVIGPLVTAYDKVSPLNPATLAQFDHAWGGFTLWDIIMPLFIFMCGAAVPLALPKRMEGGRAGWKYWRHVLSRVALLWVLGMVAQGRLLSCDVDQFCYFTNTLQAIAVGYLVAAGVWLVPNVWIRRAIPVALAVLYAVLLHYGGDYSCAGNLAMKVDMLFVNILQPVAGHDTHSYTWYLTSLMFAAMTLCGAEATAILTGALTPRRKVLALSGLGLALLAVGWALVPVIPMIKHIYTLTFTAQAMGWSCLAYAILYLVTDVLRQRRGLGVFELFGQTALTAYMIAEVFPAALFAFARQVSSGFSAQFFPSAAPICEVIVYAVTLSAILHVWRAARLLKSVNSL